MPVFHKGLGSRIPVNITPISACRQQLGIQFQIVADRLVIMIIKHFTKQGN